VPTLYVPPTLFSGESCAEVESEHKAAEEEYGITYDEFLSDPLDTLPTKFNLDSWKRAFDRAQTKTQAIDKFWEQYDNQGYSCYKIEFNPSPDEAGDFIKMSNKVGTFIYRIEPLRTRSFGTVGLYGNSTCMKIIGLFVWRGNGVPPEIYGKEAFA
jgi:hypothetical protein